MDPFSLLIAAHLESLGAPVTALVRALSLDPAERTDQLRNLDTQDWAAMVRIARFHRVGPLLYKRLVKQQYRCPPLALGELRCAYEGSVASAERIVNQVEHLAATLVSHGVPLVALKGVHLASSYFDDIALRPMGDIDLLTSLDSIPIARALLYSLDYQSIEFAPSPLDQGRLTTSPHVAAFRQDGKIQVDLHWTIESPWNTTLGTVLEIDIDLLWKGLRAVRVGSTRLFGLSSTNLLLHLCLHASLQHRFDVKMSSLYDIAVVLARGMSKVDWHTLGLLGRRYGIDRLLAAVLTTAQALFSIDFRMNPMAVEHPDDMRIPALIVLHVLRDRANPSIYGEVLTEWVREATGLIT